MTNPYQSPATVDEHRESMLVQIDWAFSQLCLWAFIVLFRSLAVVCAVATLPIVWPMWLAIWLLGDRGPKAGIPYVLVGVVATIVWELFVFFPALHHWP